MKRIFTIFAFAFSILLLTGCGSTKKLECKKVYEEYNETEVYMLEYTKDGVLQSVTLRLLLEDYIEGELTAEEKAELNSECDEIKEAGIKNLSCQVNIKEKDIEMIISATGIDKMSPEQIEEADLDDFVEYTYDELKAELIEDGYTCQG